MTRKLRPLMSSDFEKLPLGCGACMFWESHDRLDRRCGSQCDHEAQAEWFHRVVQEWGDCGRVAHEDEEVFGFIKYAPSGYFPQVRTFLAAPEDPNTPFIACLHVSEEARHRGLGTLLLRAALKDLTTRGERKVEAIAAARPDPDAVTSPFISMEFLQANGFTVVAPDPLYPLMQLELKSLVSWTENLEAVLESLKLPLRRMPERAPAPW